MDGHKYSQGSELKKDHVSSLVWAPCCGWSRLQGALGLILSLHGHISTSCLLTSLRGWVHYPLNSSFSPADMLRRREVSGSLVMAACSHKNFLQQTITQAQGSSHLCGLQTRGCSQFFWAPVAFPEGRWMSAILGSNSGFPAHSHWDPQWVRSLLWISVSCPVQWEFHWGLWCV